jgi:hypothetical protein
MRPTRTPRIALLVAVLCICTAAPAAAAPVRIRSDRSDNTLYFNYNSLTGEIPSAYSSRIQTRGDRVDFFVYVTERPGAETGKRLLGRINLRLNRNRSVRYKGRFRFVVEDATGLSTFVGTRLVDIVLRPHKGRRTRVLRWAFDLPAGDYTAFGRFRHA